jgi:hypothetical protein
MRLALCCFALVACAVAQDPDPADAKIKPREITVAAPRTGDKAGVTKFTTAADLAKAYGKDVADAVAKEVNFKKEYVVVYAWSGSGGDKLEMKVEDKKVTFSRSLGRTRDLRRHFKVFALPSDFKYDAGK